MKFVGESPLQETTTLVYDSSEPKSSGFCFMEEKMINFEEELKKLEDAITPKTKVIMPVHLYGLASNMDEICAIAEKHIARPEAIPRPSAIPGFSAPKVLSLIDIKRKP